ncbi:hypothetical protein Q5530_05525 [Saccharothrix sp. BKS2]|uniref:hypothetical protein n=1 Tax=Saccharothrix sp. BKS2 TaxID=3064400 RepID=UPI0039E7B46E
MLTQNEYLAFGAHPELRRLATLRDSGPWVWLPTARNGEVVELHGVRTWTGGYADAVRVRTATDAAAVRTDDTGGLLWQREGGLAEVVDALLELPPPDAPTAPRLVKGVGPGLWTP